MYGIPSLIAILRPHAIIQRCDRLLYIYYGALQHFSFTCAQTRRIQNFVKIIGATNLYPGNCLNVWKHHAARDPGIEFV